MCSSFFGAMGVLIGNVIMPDGFKNVRLNGLCPAAGPLFVVLSLMLSVPGSHHSNLCSRYYNSRIVILPPILPPLVQAHLVFIVFILFIVRIQISNLSMGMQVRVVFAA
jgi:hypothetical protein